MKIPKKPIPGQSFPEKWFPDIYDFIRSLIPRGDGKTVFVTHTKHGVRYSAIPQQNPAGGGAGSDYSGMFKVVDTSTETTMKVTVVDGHNSSATNCGIAIIVNSQRNIAKAELTVTATGYIILETTYNETTNAINSSVLKFVTAATFYENTKSIVLIARIFVEDSKITGIVQEHCGLIVSDIKDEC